MDHQNCYAYACGYSKDKALQPGELGGCKYKSATAQHLIDAAHVDGLTFTHAVIPSPELGEHVVALYISGTTSGAYHWLRQRSDGSGYWDHKPGMTSVRVNDATETPIHDVTNPPDKANVKYETLFTTHERMRHLLLAAQVSGMAIDYDVFVGYFRCPDDFPQIRAPQKVGCQCVIV